MIFKADGPDSNSPSNKDASIGVCVELTLSLIYYVEQYYVALLCKRECGSVSISLMLVDSRWECKLLLSWSSAYLKTHEYNVHMYMHSNDT